MNQQAESEKQDSSLEERGQEAGIAWQGHIFAGYRCQALSTVARNHNQASHFF